MKIRQLEFEIEKHRFSSQGRPVPSVTQILKDLGFGNSPYYTEEARLRGTFVHDATDFIDDEVLNWSTLDDRLRPFCEAYRDFLATESVKIQRSNVQVSNQEWWYAGIIDKELLWKGRKALVDIKTGGIDTWHPLQLAAYGDCYPNLPLLFNLYLRQDGSYRFLAIDHPERELTDWHCAVRIYRRKHG